MNLKEVHTDAKEVSAKAIFKTSSGSVTAIQIMENGLLKEHITKTPALLSCVVGEVIYEDEKGKKINLKSGDFHEIEPMVKHWVKGVSNSQLLLIK
ncbi:MAG: hypothetical protein GYB31_14250 [Bacteroidetes bacterium]|nr:hypothetical protein [Bacteroidota bacterium]